MRPRLTKLVTFKRLKSDATQDSAGQVNDSLPSNWKTLGQRRGDCRQEASTESYAQNQQQTGADWTVVCRGDALTQAITPQDVIEFTDHGMLIRLNVTGSKVIQDVPMFIEFSGTV